MHRTAFPRRELSSRVRRSKMSRSNFLTYARKYTFDYVYSCYFFCVKIHIYFCVFRLWSYWCPYILYRPIGHVSQRTIYPNIVLMPMMIDFAPASLVQKWNIHKLYSMQSLQKIKRLVFVVFDILYLCVWWPGNAFFKL